MHFTGFTVLIIANFVASSNENMIKLNDDNGITLTDKRTSSFIENYSGHRFYQTTPVLHFAVHGLCKHYKGQKFFYQALKTKLCNMRESFIADLVTNLCKKAGRDKDELSKWVKEVFDADGDGYISYYEKHFYKYND